VHDALLTYGGTLAGETVIVVRFYAFLFVIFLQVLVNRSLSLGQTPAM
jgi:hypothetical protein